MIANVGGRPKGSANDQLVDKLLRMSREEQIRWADERLYEFLFIRPAEEASRAS